MKSWSRYNGRIGQCEIEEAQKFPFVSKPVHNEVKAAAAPQEILSLAQHSFKFESTKYRAFTAITQNIPNYINGQVSVRCACRITSGLARATTTVLCRPSENKVIGTYELQFVLAKSLQQVLQYCLSY
jgi:hypothetical protein